MWWPQHAMHWHGGSAQVATVGLFFLLATRLGNPYPCRVRVFPMDVTQVSLTFPLIRGQNWRWRLYGHFAVQTHLQDPDVMCQSHSLAIFLLLIGITECEPAEMDHGRSPIDKYYFPNTCHLECGCRVPGCDWGGSRAPVVWIRKKWAEDGCKCRTVQRHASKQGALLLLNRKLTEYFHPLYPPLRIKTSPFRSHGFLRAEYVQLSRGLSEEQEQDDWLSICFLLLQVVPNTQLKHILSLWQTLSAKRSVLLVQMNQVRETAWCTKQSTRSTGREKLFDKVAFLWKTLEIFRKEKKEFFCDFSILPFSKSKSIFITSVT